ncbi:MAG: hypothetical protein HFJ06_09390 [Lachnospiraceae bacterium]|nr:hypothetical protein [Lachnospiraceae bacterium]
MLENGEEKGLSVKLLSDNHEVHILFGSVEAVRMLDEGILLGELFSDTAIIEYKKQNFSNVIYQIEEGQFGELIKQSAGTLSGILDFKHYIIVTLNYVIEVVTEWQPEIVVVR